VNLTHASQTRDLRIEAVSACGQHWLERLG
jgi:hypothetical protein